MVIEIEAYSVEEVDVRLVMNVNAVDQRETFPKDLADCQVKRFEVPVIKLRQENLCQLYISAAKAQAVFKLRRIEILLEHNN